MSVAKQLSESVWNGIKNGQEAGKLPGQVARDTHRSRATITAVFQSTSYQNFRVANNPSLENDLVKGLRNRRDFYLKKVEEYDLVIDTLLSLDESIGEI